MGGWPNGSIAVPTRRDSLGGATGYMRPVQRGRGIMPPISVHYADYGLTRERLASHQPGFTAYTRTLAAYSFTS